MANNRLIKGSMLLLLLTLFIELAFFQYSAFESLFFHEVTDFTCSFSRKAVTDDEGVVTFSKAEAYLVIDVHGQKVQNLFLDMEDAGEDAKSYLNYTLYAMDEGHGSDYYELNPSLEDYVDSYDSGSRYVRVYLYGKADKIKIVFDDKKGDSVRINEIGINRRVPFHLDLLRMAVILFCLMVLYILRPAALIHRVLLFSRDGRVMCLALAAVQMMILTTVTFYNGNYIKQVWYHHNQYQKLAESLSRGQFYLEEVPDESLTELDNPYDTTLRENSGVKYQWDYAYYNGRYYVYFGVVPVLLLYLPYYLITGSGLPNVAAVYVGELALTAGLMAFLYVFFRRYAKDLRAGTFLLLETLLLIGTSVLQLATYPTLYTVPNSIGLAFTVWGLFFWMKAAENGALKKSCLCAGSLCMALVAGCRPQLLMASFFVLFLIGAKLPDLMGQWKNGSKKTVISAGFAFALPYMIVAAFLMYYNAARFGSPFDFGANYNLTTNDMTHRGFNLGRIPLGLFMYLVQPLNMSAKYPFLRAVSTQNHYHGVTIMERMYGGFLWFCPMALFLAGLGSVKKELKERKLWGLTVSSLIFGLIIVIADTEMAGILRRYMSDFGLFFCLPAVIVYERMQEKYRNTVMEKFLEYALYVIFILTIMMQGFFLITVFY